MTFCGYNETMAAGLRTLVDGMIEAMHVRHARGVPIRDVVDQELRDLSAMNEAMFGAPSASPLLPGLCGINLFAQVIFSAARQGMTDFTSFERICREECESFIDLVRATEERHQAELERSPDGDVAIRAVARWLTRGQRNAVAA